MRFLLLTVAASPERTAYDDAIMRAVDRFNRALREAGVLLGADRLRPAVGQSREPVTGGRVDRPVSATGYWLIQVRSLDEALAWARRCPLAPDEAIEIRQALPHEARA